MTYVYAALVQKAFVIAQRQRESDVQQHAKLDDLGRRLEAERVLAHLYPSAKGRGVTGSGVKFR